MTLGWLLTNVAWGLTLVITSFVGGVMLNQCAKRREAEHAAVLQHAARRKLSMRTRGRSRGLEHDEARAGPALRRRPVTTDQKVPDPLHDRDDDSDTPFPIQW